MVGGCILRLETVRRHDDVELAGQALDRIIAPRGGVAALGKKRADDIESAAFSGGPVAVSSAVLQIVDKKLGVLVIGVLLR